MDRVLLCAWPPLYLHTEMYVARVGGARSVCGGMRRLSGVLVVMGV